MKREMRYVALLIMPILWVGVGCGPDARRENSPTPQIARGESLHRWKTMVTNIKPWAEAPRRNPTADELRQIDEFVRKYETAVNARDSKSLRQLCYNERVFLGLTLGHLFEQTDAERWRWLESERPVDAVFPAEQEWRIDVESGFAIGYQPHAA